MVAAVKKNPETTAAQEWVLRETLRLVRQDRRRADRRTYTPPTPAEIREAANTVLSLSTGYGGIDPLAAHKMAWGKILSGGRDRRDSDRRNH